jgi:hypothetical protein
MCDAPSEIAAPWRSAYGKTAACEASMYMQVGELLKNGDYEGVLRQTLLHSEGGEHK